jgi:hypothetical protein
MTITIIAVPAKPIASIVNVAIFTSGLIFTPLSKAPLNLKRPQYNPVLENILKWDL